MGPGIFDAVVDGVRNMVTTALLLVAVGIVINVVTTTGVGNAFSLMIVEWAQGSLLITLILVALLPGAGHGSACHRIIHRASDTLRATHF